MLSTIVIVIVAYTRASTYYTELFNLDTLSVIGKSALGFYKRIVSKPFRFGQLLMLNSVTGQRQR